MLKYMMLAALAGVLIVCAGNSRLTAAWVEDGIAVCTQTGVQDLPVLVSDGYGGTIVVWRDDRVINTDIYAQRIDADGTVLWPFDTARPVCTAPSSQANPRIVSDGEGGAIVAWQDPRSGAGGDVYIQRIDGDGYIQWDYQGIAVCAGQTGLTIGRMISDGSGGAIVCWSDRRYYNYNNVYVQRIDAAGVAQWTANGVSVGNVLFHQENSVLAPDGSGGAIVAWQDRRNGAADIYAQRIDAAGAIRWGPTGVAVCNYAQVQQYPVMIPDGAGGAIIAWEDRRNSVDYDIFAQRLDGSGTVQWTANGVGVSATSYNQRYCRIAVDGSGGAIVAWVDYRNGTTNADIYAQRIDAGGSRLWTSNGIAVCGAANDQLNVELVSNGMGGAIATWEDQRAGAGVYDIYAQRIDENGAFGWTAGGLAVCRAAANQETPQLAPDEWGGASFAWMDERGGVADIYGQKIDAAGNIGTATLLDDFTAVWRDGNVVLEWTLSEIEEDASYIVLRAIEPSMSFEEISTTGVRGDGTSFTFTDAACDPGAIYRYRVDVSEGQERRILFETGPLTVPQLPVALYQNAPNPFNPSTEIRYYLPERCFVTLDVYDVGGTFVTRLVSGHRDRGVHAVSWDGSDAAGGRISTGVYFYRLEAGKATVSKKMILLR